MSNDFSFFFLSTFRFSSFFSCLVVPSFSRQFLCCCYSCIVRSFGEYCIVFSSLDSHVVWFFLSRIFPWCIRANAFENQELIVYCCVWCMLNVECEPVVRRTSPFDLYLSLLAVSAALIVHRSFEWKRLSLFPWCTCSLFFVSLFFSRSVEHNNIEIDIGICVSMRSVHFRASVWAQPEDDDGYELSVLIFVCFFYHFAFIFALPKRSIYNNYFIRESVFFVSGSFFAYSFRTTFISALIFISFMQFNWTHLGVRSNTPHNRYYRTLYLIIMYKIKHSKTNSRHDRDKKVKNIYITQK